MHTLYRLVFGSGKTYIGQTTRPLKTRMVAHRQAVKRGSKLPVHCAWRVHGEPQIEVIGNYETHEDLHAAEVDAIRTMNTLCPHGYNVTIGGDTAPSKNPIVAAKIAEKARGRKRQDKDKLSALVSARWGDPEYRAKVAAGVAAYWTPERRAERAEMTRARMASMSPDARKLSEETKRKIASHVKTDEARARMSASAKARIREPRNAETCAKLSVSVAASWQDPKVSERRAAAIRNAWTQEKRAAFSEKLRILRAKQVSPPPAPSPELAPSVDHYAEGALL